MARSRGAHRGGEMERAKGPMQAEAQRQSATSGVVRKARIFLDAIKFEHTIFALPFAYLGMVLASRANHGWPGLDKLIWITLAMAGARTLAMTLNRLIDARADALNPRTANRALPKKLLRPGEMVIISIISAEIGRASCR